MDNLLYVPLIIATMVKYAFVPFTKEFVKINWTPSLTKACVYLWSFLLTTIVMHLGYLGDIGPDVLWRGLSASIVAGTGAIGIHESTKKNTSY